MQARQIRSCFLGIVRDKIVSIGTAEALPAELMQLRIDLGKAQVAPYSSYMFRSLLALNDLLSIHYLSMCFQKDQPDIHIRNGVESYLVRLMQAHTVEAYMAFVVSIKPGKNGQPLDDVYNYIQSKPDLKNRFDELLNNLSDKFFKAMMEVRSTFTFHYNYEDCGRETAEALARLLRVSETDKSNGGEDLIIYDPHSPKILDEDYILQTRFVCADRLVNEGMAMLNGLAEGVDHESNPDSGKFKKSIVEFSSDFIIFAQFVVMEWIKDNKLQHQP